MGIVVNEDPDDEEILKIFSNENVVPKPFLSIISSIMLPFHLTSFDRKNKYFVINQSIYKNFRQKMGKFLFRIAFKTFTNPIGLYATSCLQKPCCYLCIKSHQFQT